MSTLNISHSQEICRTASYDSLVISMVEILTKAAENGKVIHFYDLMRTTDHFKEPRIFRGPHFTKYVYGNADQQEFFTALRQIHGYILANNLPDIVSWTGQPTRNGVVPSDYFYSDYEEFLGEEISNQDRISFFMARREEAKKNPGGVIDHLVGTSALDVPDVEEQAMA